MHLTFDLDASKSNNKLDIMITDTVNKRKRAIEGWSGGQRDKMSISIYLALNKLAKMKSGVELNFLILDEKLASIDEESHPILLDVLKNERAGRKIFCISHVNNIESEFDEVVNVVQKKNGTSEIKVRYQNVA